MNKSNENAILILTELIQLVEYEVISFPHFIRSFDDILLELGSDVCKLPWSAILHQLENRLTLNSLPSLKDLRKNCVFSKTSEWLNSKEIIYAISGVVNEYKLYNSSSNISSVFKGVTASNLDVPSPFVPEDSFRKLRRTLSGLGRQTYQLKCSTLDCPTNSIILKKFSTSWGQRKLIMMEISFLSRYSSPGDIVVYAGAAPGIHIPYLAGDFFAISNHRIITYAEFLRLLISVPEI